MLRSLSAYWRDDSGVVTMEYSLIFLAIAVVAACAGGRVGDCVVCIVDEVAAFFG
jgi:Flp pilus assembly pilin Flp